MKPLGDRRGVVRLEVLGTLRGTLELSETGRLVNISAHGALIETLVRVPVGAFQEVQLTIDGLQTRVAGRVRRLEQLNRPNEPPQYLIGLEFLAPSTGFAQSIEQLARES